MTYRRPLLTRWSQRDRLSVVVVAVAVAFIIGTVILVTAAGAQTTAIAGQYTANTTITTHDSVAAAQTAAGPGGVVVPFTTVQTDGGTRLLVGPPSNTSLVGNPPATEDSVTLGTATTQATQTISHAGQSVSVTVTPRQRGVVPPWWYVGSQSLVTDLGPTGVFLIEEVPSEQLPNQGTPLVGVLPFFVFGSRQALRALSIVAGGSTILIGVVIYSVTRMTVRDRRRTIAIIRATGGTRPGIVGLFGLRALLVGAVGTAVGYAIGVILVNAVVNVAVFAGLPIALDVTVTARMARVIGVLCVAVLGVAFCSGVIAAVPAIRGDVLAREATSGSRLQLPNRLSWLTPTLLDWRALVPTAATLSTFVAFVIVVAGVSGALAPLTATTGATVTEPGAKHPIASSVPETTAGALRAQGIPASPEVLVFSTTDGQPYLIRGVNFSAFQAVTPGELQGGRVPRDQREAVIGVGLARTLGVQPGDTMTLGGSTTAKVTQVEVVGVYAAPGPFDDQLLIPLATGQHLANKRPGTVHFVRATRLPEGGVIGSDGGALRVTSIAAPSVVTPNQTFTARVQIQNQQNQSVTQTVRIQYGTQTRRISVAVAADATTQVTAQFTAGEMSDTLRVGQATQTVSVRNVSAVSFGWLPARAPPNATFTTRVTSPFGGSVRNATVTLNGTTQRVGSDGRVVITTPQPGEYTLVLTNGSTTVTRNITIRAGALRSVRPDVTISPSQPDLLTEPVVTLTIQNPWQVNLTRNVTISGPSGAVTQSVVVPAGGQTAVRQTLVRRPPGMQTVTVTVGQQAPIQQTYRVTGDERVAATLAEGGQVGTSGIGRTIESAFGNLQVVIVTLVFLAGLTAVGGTTATFAQSIHVRRQSIGVRRATGAPPLAIIRLVLTDALRIGAVATVGALCIGYVTLSALSAAGILTVFGIRLAVSPSLSVIAGIIVGALVVTAVGALLATTSLVRVSPARLLGDEMDASSVTEDRPE